MAKQWQQLEKLDHKALKKLQAEREKQKQQAAAAEAKKRTMVIIFILAFCFILVVAFVVQVKEKSDALEYDRIRQSYYVYKITEISGTPQYTKMGIWEPLDENVSPELSDECGFKTNEKESVAVQLQLENQVKLLEKGEMLIKKATLAEKENKVEKEEIELTSGEITVTITLDGRDLITIRIPEIDITIAGKSGLFKVIYNQKKQQGEVVVKNGLVEVVRGEEIRKVAGFYKVTYDRNKLSKPTQASVIQYDWK